MNFGPFEALHLGPVFVSVSQISSSPVQALHEEAGICCSLDSFIHLRRPLCAFLDSKNVQTGDKAAAGKAA